jgi:hypothetical protein
VLSRASWLCFVAGALLFAVAIGIAHGVPPANAATLLRGGDASGASAPEKLTAEREALVRRWAPSFVQHTSAEHPERDLPLRVDFDGDWDATNNWRHLTAALRQETPSVYYSAILSTTHAYLTFTLFYPRDWSWPVCVDYVCHDNDLEVALLVVSRAADPAQSALVFLETKAHNSYEALSASTVAVDAAGRPIIEVESQGHGMYARQIPLAVPSAGDAVILDGPVGDGRHGYELVSLHDTLWARRSPAVGHSSLWAPGSSGFLGYSGARQARLGFALGVAMASEKYAGGVRPAWGLQAPVGERGDWFLDPAYVASQRHPDWFTPPGPSLEYVDNVYLRDLSQECRGHACPVILPPPSHPAPLLAGGTLLFGLGFLLSVKRRPRAGRPPAEPHTR